MDERRRVRISKYLSKHLRHRPDRLGIRVLQGGWVAVDELLVAMANQRMPIDRNELEAVVHESRKPRFSFDESGTLIRANYGHTIPVDPDLSPGAPPPTLYHGTAEHMVERILREGLKPMARRYVHLYEDPDPAREVGSRHGSPQLLLVYAAQLHEQGQPFYHAGGGIWLVETVQPGFLAPLGDG